MKIQQWEVAVFAEGPWQGNRAVVQLHPQALTGSAMQSMAAEAQAPATCFAWPAPGCYQVRCFSPVSPIQCCGHGLLATAHVLHSHLRITADHQAVQRPLRLVISSAGSAVNAVPAATHGRAVATGDDQQYLWLCLPRLECRGADVPRWVEDTFGRRPIGAATAGGDQGYWVFEFAPERDLASLPVLLEVLVQNTSRAVIVTSADASERYHFLLRYFAPQYGVNEDGVTGSAVRVLADYWQAKTGLQYFCARQCSEGGGVARVRLDAANAAITGRLEIIEQRSVNL